VRDRYQLAATVTGTVACAWLDAWRAARDAGDDTGVEESVDTMAISHDWAILHRRSARATAKRWGARAGEIDE
jgi:hypothetical protein